MAQNPGFRLNMHIGTPLLINIQGLDAKIKTKLIGMEPWEYLIIKAPVGYAGIRNKMVEGNKVIVRFVQDGTVYGFESYILAVVDKPASLLFIDCPHSIEEKSLRQSERKDCYITCSIEINGEESEGALVDISTAGCRCIASHLDAAGKSGPPLGSSITIVFDSPAEDWQMVLEGVVVNTTEYHAAARLGIKFSDEAEDKLQHIQKLLDYLD